MFIWQWLTQCSQLFCYCWQINSRLPGKYLNLIFKKSAQIAPPSGEEFKNMSLVTNFAQIKVDIVCVRHFRGHKHKKNIFECRFSFLNDTAWDVYILWKLLESMLALNMAICLKVVETFYVIWFLFCTMIRQKGKDNNNNNSKTENKTCKAEAGSPKRAHRRPLPIGESNYVTLMSQYHQITLLFMPKKLMRTVLKGIQRCLFPCSYSFTILSRLTD